MSKYKHEPIAFYCNLEKIRIASNWTLKNFIDISQKYFFFFYIVLSMIKSQLFILINYKLYLAKWAKNNHKPKK